MLFGLTENVDTGTVHVDGAVGLVEEVSRQKDALDAAPRDHELVAWCIDRSAGVGTTRWEPRRDDPLVSERTLEITVWFESGDNELPPLPLTAPANQDRAVRPHRESHSEGLLGPQSSPNLPCVT